MDIWQKPEAPERAFRTAQPRADLSITRRERCAEGGVVTSGNPPGSPVLGKDEQHRYPVRDEPEALLGNDRRQPRLRVKDADRLLERAPLALGLGDEYGLRGVMRTQHVDRSALAPLREGDLGRRSPVVAAEHSDGRFDDPCVSLVEQPIEGSAVPPCGQADGRTQTSEVIADVADAEPLSLTRFQLQGEVSRSAGRNHVALAKPVPFSQRSGGPRKTFIITRHGRILAAGSYVRLACDLPGAFVHTRHCRDGIAA